MLSFTVEGESPNSRAISVTERPWIYRATIPRSGSLSRRNRTMKVLRSTIPGKHVCAVDCLVAHQICFLAKGGISAVRELRREGYRREPEKG